MRLLCVFGVMWLVSLAGIAAARGETKIPRAECVKLAKEQKALEADGLDKFLKMPPQAVIAKRGRPVVERVRHYIALREKVLFQCPRHVLNATRAPLAHRKAMPPPLPGKGPKRARLQRLAPGMVPLPVKRRLRFKIPTSPG